MSAPLLHRHTEQLSDRELFVHALLGLLSYGQSVRDTLHRIAPKGPREARDEPDAVTYMLLGCLSIERRLLAELSSWRSESKAKRSNRRVRLDEGGGLL